MGEPGTLGLDLGEPLQETLGGWSFSPAVGIYKALFSLNGFLRAEIKSLRWRFLWEALGRSSAELIIRGIKKE